MTERALAGVSPLLGPVRDGDIIRRTLDTVRCETGMNALWRVVRVDDGALLAQDLGSQIELVRWLWDTDGADDG